jgi:phospholipid-binding lipoprotein MlaA
MNNKRAALTMAAASLVLALTSGCATGPNRTPGDPFEPANRVIFKVNDTVDRTIAQPVAKGYQKVTPQPLRQAISNFFSNLGDIGNFANNLLQLKITDATEDLMRLAMNTTFGLGGLIDFATPAGLPKHHQDFGLTLGRYGIPAGPYLVLPLFGPSSVRDGIGMAVDVKFNILNYIAPAWRNPMYVTQFVSTRSDLLGATNLLEQAALDKYSFVRDAFRQQRESLLRGSSGKQALPDYGDPGSSGGPEKSNGVPNYDDPGDSGGKGGGSSNDLPNYDDPGASGESGASGVSATGAAGAADGAVAPHGDPAPVGASETGAAVAPVAASAAVAASGTQAQTPATPADAAASARASGTTAAAVTASGIQVQTPATPANAAAPAGAIESPAAATPVATSAAVTVSGAQALTPANATASVSASEPGTSTAPVAASATVATSAAQAQTPADATPKPAAPAAASAP